MQEELQVDCSYNVDCVTILIHNGSNSDIKTSCFASLYKTLYKIYCAPFFFNWLVQNVREKLFWAQVHSIITWFGNNVKWASNASSQLRDQLNVLWLIRITLGRYHHNLVKTHSYSLILKIIYCWDMVCSGSSWYVILHTDYLNLIFYWWWQN